jgi:hypothetical protein
MNSKEFNTGVGRKCGIPRDTVQKVITAMVDYAKEIMAEGDTWRIPGLGNMYCMDVPAGRYLDRFHSTPGKEIWLDFPARKRIKMKFSPYCSANKDVMEAENPEDCGLSVAEEDDDSDTTD